MLPALESQSKREKGCITNSATPSFLRAGREISRLGIDQTHFLFLTSGSITAESVITIFPVENSAKELFGWLL